MFLNDQVTKSYQPRGDHHDFLSRECCSKVPKRFVGEPFSVSILSGIEKFFAQQAHVTIFRRNCFVSQCRNIS